jgi:hypothetical protein
MTDDDIVEGWYTDSEGSIRWWDGSQWTEHVRSAAGDTEATAVIPAERSATTTRRADPEPEPDHKRRVVLTATVVGLLAFFLGLGIGGGGSSDPPVVAEATAASGATEEDLDRREAELESREGDLTTREKELDQREQDLEARELQEPSVTGDATIGNGVFEVGEDVQPGQYATEGSDDPDLPCTYKVSEDEDGDEIIISEVSDGPGTVTLEDGQYFTSEYCQTWESQ